MVKPHNKTIRSKNGSAEERILRAAREEFIERGLRGGRMQSIANRANANKALLHYYFRTKERLYEAVLENILATIGSALRSQLPLDKEASGLRGLLRQIITVYINTFRANPDFPRFIMRELADGGAHLPTIVNLFITGFGDIPQRIYTLLQKEYLQGKLRKVVPIHIALNIVGMCIFTFIARPILAIVDERTSLHLAFDDRFFADRINAIVTMACDGIFKERQT
ncbi:MAG: TetR/AcrR family transcriptional regulator [Chitinispirillaceae bacterium]|jgi:AcrR family transcriptional regulator